MTANGDVEEGAAAQGLGLGACKRHGDRSTRLAGTLVNNPAEGLGLGDLPVTLDVEKGSSIASQKRPSHHQQASFGSGAGG